MVYDPNDNKTREWQSKLKDLTADEWMLVFDLSVYEDAQMDLIFSTFDELLRWGLFDKCDDIIKIATERIDKIPTICYTTFLIVSGWAREKIPSRKEFYNKAEQIYLREYSPEQTKRILANLA